MSKNQDRVDWTNNPAETEHNSEASTREFDIPSSEEEAQKLLADQAAAPPLNPEMAPAKELSKDDEEEMRAKLKTAADGTTTDSSASQASPEKT